MSSDCVQQTDEPIFISVNGLDLIFTGVLASVKTNVCEYIGTLDSFAIEMDISVNQYIPNATLKKKKCG